MAQPANTSTERGAPSTGATRFVGTLSPFFETGTEGVVWSTNTSGAIGYDGLTCLNPGDGLLIYDRSGKPIWTGEIDFEYERCWQAFPLNPKHGKQAVRGMWVNGLQRDVDPDTWMGWFQDELPAVVWIRAQAHEAHCTAALQAMNREQAVLAEALSHAALHPEEAWATIERDAPGLAQRMRSGIAYVLEYRLKHMGWPLSTANVAATDFVEAWKLLLAIDRAGRALGGGSNPWKALAGRWPSGGDDDRKAMAELGRKELLHDRDETRPAAIE